MSIAPISPPSLPLSTDQYVYSPQKHFRSSSEGPKGQTLQESTVLYLQNHYAHLQQTATQFQRQFKEVQSVQTCSQAQSLPFTEQSAEGKCCQKSPGSRNKTAIIIVLSLAFILAILLASKSIFHCSSMQSAAIHKNLNSGLEVSIFSKSNQNIPLQQNQTFVHETSKPLENMENRSNDKIQGSRFILTQENLLSQGAQEKESATDPINLPGVKLQNKIFLNNFDSANFTLRKEFRLNTPPASAILQDKYEFNISADDLVYNSSLKKHYEDLGWFATEKMIGVDPAQHERAIRLLQLTHNINFRGDLVFDHFNFYSSPKNKYETLKKLLQDEKDYFEKTYNISKYIKDQLRFCVYVPSYNNAQNRLYLRNLDSIFQQEYTNYHVVYVDDASTDGTGQFVEKYMVENQIPPSMYTIVRNTKNKGNSHNIYVAGNNFCQPGEIMVLVDGDDMLVGRQVFSLLNAFYQQKKPAIVYTQFLIVYPDHIGNSTNREIERFILEAGTWRRVRNFYTSHLKTFYTDLFRKIKISDMQFYEDYWIPHSSDVAYMTPMNEMAGLKLEFLTEICYQYRHDLSSNQDYSGFVYSNPRIFDKGPYSVLKDLAFTEQPITRHYQLLPDQEKKLLQTQQNCEDVSVVYYNTQSKKISPRKKVHQP